jgi:hypothetical protein
VTDEPLPDAILARWSPVPGDLREIVTRPAYRSQAPHGHADRGGAVRGRGAADGDRRWSRILGVEETAATFILRLGDGRASDGPLLLVAKRGIVPPADESGLRGLLGRYAPGS